MRKIPFFLFLAIALVSVSANAEPVPEGKIVITDVSIRELSLFDMLFGISIPLQSNVPFEGIGVGESHEFFVDFFGQSSLSSQPAKVSIEIYLDSSCSGGTSGGGCSSPIRVERVSLTSGQASAMSNPNNVVGVRFTLLAPSVAGTYQVCGYVLNSDDGRVLPIPSDCARFTVRVQDELHPFCPDSGSSPVECVCKPFDCNQVTETITGGTKTSTQCVDYRFVSSNSCPKFTSSVSGVTVNCNSGYVRSGNSCVLTTTPPGNGGGGDVACTSAAWQCGDFGNCIDGVEARTCTLADTTCTNPNAVKPQETQSCSDTQVPEECKDIAKDARAACVNPQTSVLGTTCSDCSKGYEKTAFNRCRVTNQCAPFVGSVTPPPITNGGGDKVIPIDVAFIEDATFDELSASFCFTQNDCSYGRCVGVKRLSSVYGNVKDYKEELASPFTDLRNFLNTIALGEFERKQGHAPTPSEVSRGGICVIGDVPSNVVDKFLGDISDETGFSATWIIGGIVVIVLFFMLFAGGKK